MTLLLICWAASANAQSTEALLSPWIQQLGSDGFKQRSVAEKKLVALAEDRVDIVTGELRRQMEQTGDPEIKLRLIRILRTIARTYPKARIPFNQAELETGAWALMDHLDAQAAYRFDDGVLAINSLANVKDGLAFHAKLPRHPEAKKFGDRQPAAEDVERVVLDLEIKVEKEQHENPNGAGVHLNIEDYWSSSALMISEDRIFLYRTRLSHAMDTTDDWHHYRFVIDGATQQVFVDDMDTPIFDIKRTRVGGRYWVSFGDGTAMAGAKAQFRNVSFSRLKTEK